MHGYLSLDIICSSELTVFFELRSRKTVRFSEQVMSADKYPCIFSRQMETIVYIIPETKSRGLFDDIHWAQLHFLSFYSFLLQKNIKKSRGVHFEN